MALPSGFRERLEHMEQTRNQRVSFLQAEKELQIHKSQVLVSKLSDIRSVEKRCLKLDHKISSQQFIISSLKSEIDHLDFKYLNNLERFRYLRASSVALSMMVLTLKKHILCSFMQVELTSLRVLKSEVEQLKESEKEKQIYFGLRTREMEEFRAKVEDFTAECQKRVEELRNRMKELKSTFTKLKSNISYSDNSELAAAEMRKSELLAVKQNLDKHLASNYKIRTQLQKQLQSILMTQNEGEERNPSEFSQDKLQN